MRPTNDQSAVSETLQEVTGLVPPQLTLLLWVAQLLVAVLVACAIIKRPSVRAPSRLALALRPWLRPVTAILELAGALSLVLRLSSVPALALAALAVTATTLLRR